jgi:hypothetical protein
MFKKLGYFKEYYINNKLIGTLICDKDRDVYGFFGMKIEIIEFDLILSNKKIIKKGKQVNTFLFELCGQKL